MVETSKRERVILPALLFAGILLIVVSLVSLFRQTQSSIPAGLSMTHFTFSEDVPMPYLLLEDGRLFIPSADDATWEQASIDGTVHDVYVDDSNQLWAATSDGIQRHDGESWQLINPTPARSLIPVDSEKDVVRVGEDGRIEGTLERTAIPDANVLDDVQQIVTMGDDDHSHVARSGDEIYISIDIDYWEQLEAPAPIYAIWEDGDGHIYASTERGILRWWWEDNRWEDVMPLVGDMPFDDLRVFNDVVFATADGQLMRYEGEMWQSVTLGDAPFYAASLELDNNNQLWVLDTLGEQLWSTHDGENWSQTTIRLANDDDPAS